jgi:hypothetical protein
MKYSPRSHTDVVKRDRLGSEYRENAYAHIESVRAALERIPVEFRMSAIFEIRTWLDRDGLEEHAMTVSYERPPTAAEAKQQIEDDQKRISDEIEWFQERGRELMREAAQCGYRIPEEKWPFKAELPAPLEGE